MLSATDEWICCWLWSTYFRLLGTVFVSWFSQKWQLRLQSCPPETARIPLGNGRCPGNTSWRQQERPSCFIFFHDLCCLCKWFVCQGKMPEGHEPPSDWLMYDLTPDSYKRLQAIKLLKVRDRLYLWSFLMIPQGQGLMDSGFCPLECEVGKLNKLRAPNEHRLIDFRSGLLNQILHREVSNRGQGRRQRSVYVGLSCSRLWFDLCPFDSEFPFAKGWRSCGHPWPGISDGLDTERSGSLYDDACLSKQLFLVESKCMIKRIVNSKGTALYWRTTASAGFVWQVHRGMWHRTDHEGDLTQILPSSR